MELPETFSFGKRYWYPHMKPRDIAIWERFIEKYPDYFERVQYDVPCGTGPDFDTLIDDYTGAHAEKLYKKKIDVVAFRGANISIIEVKPSAGASAVGQVRMYKHLYLADYSPPDEPELLIITDKADKDFERFAKAEGVGIFVV